MAELLPLDDAVARCVAEAHALLERVPTQTRTVGLWDASGYVLAAPVTADRDMPPFRKSMMDGYAVRAADLSGERNRLRVIGEVAAGARFEGVVETGQAVRIMTGAPLPDGADCVQMVENSERDGDDVLLDGPLAAGRHVVPRGQDVATGDVVAEPGRVIESLTAGVLGAVGAAQIEVYRRPRVTVLTTGDELVSLDETPGPNQIRDSNRRTLMALLEREFCRVVDGGIASDDLPTIRSAIRAGLESDVLVLTGGVSAGVYDLVAEALADEGVETVFHKIALKPGKPALVGRHAGGLVFGLPGNPVSTYVVAMMLLVPTVRVLGRRPDHRSWTLDVPLVGELPKTGGRTTVHPGALERGADGALSVHMLPWNGSADQVAYARANVMIRCEAGDPPRTTGDVVRVLLPHALTL